MFTILIVCALSYALWKLLQLLSTKSALDNLPGPPSRSFLFGDLIFQNHWPSKPLLASIQSPGVFPQFFNIRGWEFHKEIAQRCMNIFHFPKSMMLMPRRWRRYED